MDSESILFEGWLEKKGSFIANWKRRWFVLSSSKLEYYVEENKATKKGDIVVNETTKVLTRDGSTHAYKFGVMSGTRILELSADTDKDRIDWMDKIQTLVKRIIKINGPGIVNDDKSIIGTIFTKSTNMEEDTPMNRAMKGQQLGTAPTSRQNEASISTAKPMKRLNAKTNKPQRAEAAVPMKTSKSHKEDGEGDNTAELLSAALGSSSLGGKAKTKRSASGANTRHSEEDISATNAKYHYGDAEEEMYGSKSYQHHNSKSGHVGKDVEVSAEDTTIGTSTTSGSRSRKKSDASSRRREAEGRSSVTSASCDAAVEEELAHGWEEVYTEEGQKYYYHKVTRVSRWDKPTPEIISAMESRLEESQRQVDEAIERRKLEREKNERLENEIAETTEMLKQTVKINIYLWKNPPGNGRCRSLPELLQAIPELLGDSLVPRGSISSVELNIHSTPAEVKKAYMKTVRLIHPDKITQNSNAIDLENKLLAQEVFIEVNQQYDTYRKAHGL